MNRPNSTNFPRLSTCSPGVRHAAVVEQRVGRVQPQPGPPDPVGLAQLGAVGAEEAGGAVDGGGGEAGGQAAGAAEEAGKGFG